MGIDDNLRAAQERQRSEARAEADKQAAIEQKRLDYHAEESTVAAEISAVIRRAQDLLDAKHEWCPVETFMPSRFERSLAYCDGRPLSFPTSLGSEEFVLLPTGHIIRVQRWLRRREAHSAVTIDEWSAVRVQVARSNPAVEASSHYDDAFDSRWPTDKALSTMQRNLVWVRERVEDAVARMLADAGIHP
ncbi:MAG TPA: hypothetical protein VGI76_08585 [Solirubrobacteraceae bacterium]|jgi:hypothetical protein